MVRGWEAGRRGLLFWFFFLSGEVLRRTKEKFIFEGFRVSGSELTFSRFLKEADVPLLELHSVHLCRIQKTGLVSPSSLQEAGELPAGSSSR